MSSRRLVVRIVRLGHHGQSVVEMALILPVLLLIALGTIDVGRLFFDYLTLRNAAAETALYWSRHPSKNAGDIQTLAETVFVPEAYRSNPVTTAYPSRDPACTTPEEEGFATVSLSRSFSPVSFDVLDFLGPNNNWTLTVNPSAKARCLT